MGFQYMSVPEKLFLANVLISYLWLVGAYFIG